MNVTYSMQLLAGMLVFTMGAYFFAERAGQRGHGEESVASLDSELHTVLTHKRDHKAVGSGASVDCGSGRMCR
jgi:hypothetical protein